MYVADPAPCFHTSPAWEGSLVDDCSARMQRLSLFVRGVGCGRPPARSAALLGGLETQLSGRNWDVRVLPVSSSIGEVRAGNRTD